ncbi:MAG: hypothetical protein WBY88_01290 [Desulfosarcina sp.]
MKKVLIKTLGCKVNQCESESIANALETRDPDMTAGETGSADVVIVNTCTVTRKAAMQSRQTIRRIIRENPGARIVVTGCHAQTAPAELAAIDGVDLIVGNRDKHRIPSWIVERWPTDVRIDGKAVHRHIKGIHRFDVIPGVAHGHRTRPF